MKTNKAFPFFFLGHGNIYCQFYVTVIFQQEVGEMERAQIEQSIPASINHRIIWNRKGFIAYGFDGYSYPIDYAAISAKYVLNDEFRRRYANEVETVLQTLEFAQQVENNILDPDAYNDVLEKTLRVPEGLDLFEDSRINGKSLNALEEETEQLELYSFMNLSDDEHVLQKEHLVQWVKHLHESHPLFLVYTPANLEYEPRPNKSDWDLWSQTFLEDQIKPALTPLLASSPEELDELTVNTLNEMLHYASN